MVIVEVLGRGGRVAERVRLAALPATVGRGYGSDVIVEDPYADAVHARISEGPDGGVVVEDLGSANGLFAGEFGARQERLALRPGGVFRVGHTLLRVATPDTPVAAALRDGGPESRGRRLARSRAAAAALTVAGAVLFGLSSWLGSTEEPGGAAFLEGLLAGIAFVALWAGGWALATRLRSGHSRFLAHVTVAWLFLITATVAGWIEGWVLFFTEDSFIADVAQLLAVVLIVTVASYGHLAIASRLARRVRLLVGVAASIAILALAALLDQADLRGAFDEDIAVEMPLKPLAARWIPAETPAEFLERAAELQRAVDEEAAADAAREK